MKSISHGTVMRAHQVGDEEHRALQHADQQRVEPGVVARDLGAELDDPAAELRPPRPAPRRSAGRARPRSGRSSRRRIPASRGGPKASVRRSRHGLEVAPEREPLDPRAAAGEIDQPLGERARQPQRPPGGALGRVPQHDHPQRAREHPPAGRGRARPDVLAGQLASGARRARRAAPPSRARLHLGAGVDAPERGHHVVADQVAAQASCRRWCGRSRGSSRAARTTPASRRRSRTAAAGRAPRPRGASAAIARTPDEETSR